MLNLNWRGQGKFCHTYDSICTTVLTISPNNCKQECSPCNTPTMIGPLCKLNHIIRLMVSSPSVVPIDGQWCQLGTSIPRQNGPWWVHDWLVVLAHWSWPHTVLFCFFWREGGWKTQELSEQSIRSREKWAGHLPNCKWSQFWTLSIDWWYCNRISNRIKTCAGSWQDNHK